MEVESEGRWVEGGRLSSLQTEWRGLEGVSSGLGGGCSGPRPGGSSPVP